VCIKIHQIPVRFAPFLKRIFNRLDIPARSRFDEPRTNFSGSILAGVRDRSFLNNFSRERRLVQANGIQPLDSTVGGLPE